MADNMPRSAAMNQLLKSLGDSVSGFLITPPGFDAPAAMINITPLPGDFDLHGAFAGPLEEMLAAAAEEQGEAPPMMEPPADEIVALDLEGLDEEDDDEPSDLDLEMAEEEVGFEDDDLGDDEFEDEEDDLDDE